MEGFHLFKVADPGKPDTRDIYVHAMKAKAVIDPVQQQFRRHLYDAMFQTTDADSGKPQIILAEESVPVILPYETRSSKKDPATMSNSEIREAMAELREWDRQRVEDGKKAQWFKYLPRHEAEIQRRYASSLACLAFAFIGVPLGIKARRKDTSSGLILSLLIGAAYFICGMIGGKSQSTVQLAAWAPNVVCVLLGLVLLRRARFR